MDSNFFVYLLYGGIAALTAIVYWLFRRQDLFKDKNVPYIKSPPLWGSFGDVMTGKTGFYDHIVTLYNQPEVKDKPFFGFFMFHKHCIMINDPELIKRVLVKDFHNFPNRYAGTYDQFHDPIGYYNLFSVKSPLWKPIRGKLSPFFSSGKLKTMYYLIEKISEDMMKHIHKKASKNNQVELELKSLAALYSTDVIASCAYGVEANSIENPDGEFRKAGDSIFASSFRRDLELLAFMSLPQSMKLFGFKVFSKLTTKFIQKNISYVMDEREKNGNKRNDLIDTLVELKKNEIKNSDGDDLLMDNDMIMAQAAIFLSAGFETSSATQSFALYHIAMDEEIQKRIRGEVRDMLVKTEGKVNYDSVMNTADMPYLHQILMETLRLYPILPTIDRECVNKEGYSLEPFSDFKIPYGAPTQIPTFAIHRDAKNYPEPLKFDPNRFAPENIHNIKPFTHFPFGVGPRNCIGERFGLMQVKTGIVKTLKDFRLEPTENTPKVITLEKAAIVVQSEKGLFVNLILDPLY